MKNIFRLGWMIFLTAFLMLFFTSCTKAREGSVGDIGGNQETTGGTSDTSGGGSVGISCSAGSGVVVGKCGADIVKEAGLGYGAGAPAKGASYSDPDFSTTIRRITNKSADGYSGFGIENEYARSDPENSDGTYIILRGNGGQWYLYNTAAFQLVKQLTIEGGGEEPEPRWDSADPKTFYYLYGTQLRSCNVETYDATVVCDFKNAFSGASYITTKTEGDASLDRRYWCFMVENDNQGLMSVATYDKANNSILAQKSSFPDGINWVSMDMSGKHCAVGYEDDNNDGYTPPLDVFSVTNFSKTATLPEGSTGHMDLALDANGKDVMVFQNNATDWISMADLLTGAETQLVKIPFSVDPPAITVHNIDIGLHFSGNCAQKPGWVLVSTYGSKNPPTGAEDSACVAPNPCAHTWMDNRLFLVELKANPTIKMIANTKAYTSLNYTGDKNYFAEAFAAINTKGTKIYFGSNWSDFTNSEYSDAYVVTVP